MLVLDKQNKFLVHMTEDDIKDIRRFIYIIKVYCIFEYRISIHFTFISMIYEVDVNIHNSNL